MTPGDADRSPSAPLPDDPAQLIDDRTRLYDDESQLPERRLSLGWIDAMVRHRRTLFVLVSLLYLASFNGLWRVGVDSALYRGLAHSLAIGRGYTFAGEAHHHAFAGLPWMLAVCEKLFGVTVVPAQILITLMALATVWMTYRLIALHYPIWVATIVAIAMGTNFRFLRLSQELMTDVPFTLGVVVTLYGLERLRMIALSDRRATLIAAATFVGGLLFSATLRPTVGVLAGAIVLASLVRAIRADGNRRALHVIICASAIAACLAFLVIDRLTRTRGISLLGGVYEQELFDRVQTLPVTIFSQLEQFLSSSLNDCFFSQKLQPFSIPAALLVLIGAALVMRRNLAWGLMVVGVIAITLPLSTAPRYYLMVTPILWLGWLILFSKITLSAPPIARGAIMLVAVATPLAMNLGRDSGFVTEQRAGDIAYLRGTAPSREAGFYAEYRGGEIPRLQMYGAAIAAHAGVDDRVLGPSARILTYYADRRVYGDRELFQERGVSRRQMPFKLQQFKPDLAIFPADAYDKDSDGSLRGLIGRRIVSPTGPHLADMDFAWLAVPEIRPPPPGTDWKDWRPPERRGAGTQATTRKSSLRGLSTTQRAEVLAKRERKAAAERREQQQAKRDRAEAAARRERAAKREQQEAKQAAKERREAQERKERREAQAAKERRQRRETNAPTTQP